MVSWGCESDWFDSRRLYKILQGLYMASFKVSRASDWDVGSGFGFLGFRRSAVV